MKVTSSYTQTITKLNKKEKQQHLFAVAKPNRLINQNTVFVSRAEKRKKRKKKSG